MKIAFATCDRYPSLTDDDQLVISELSDSPISVAAATWNNPRIDWTLFDLVVIRSTWDYWFHLNAFLEWIGRLGDRGIKVMNPPAALKWNIEKTYLKELESKGIPIVPTAWIETNLSTSLNKSFGQWSPDIKELIVKPTISGDAHKTYRFKATELEEIQEATREILQTSSVMIQPFLDEILSEGEWSFVFFNKKFSHAVVKKPKDKDFRVQYGHGGTATPANPAASWITQAERVISKIEWPLLYARVDMVPRNGTLLLMELEILEPSLYLGQSPVATGNFANALLTCKP